MLAQPFGSCAVWTHAILQEEVKFTSTEKEWEQQPMSWPYSFQDRATDGVQARTSPDGVMIMATMWRLDSQTKVQILPSRSCATWTWFSATLTFAPLLPKVIVFLPRGWWNGKIMNERHFIIHTGLSFSWWLVQSLAWSVKLVLFSDHRLYPWFYPTTPQMYAIIPKWWEWESINESLQPLPTIGEK